MKGLLKYGVPLILALVLAAGFCIFAMSLFVHAESPSNGIALPAVKDAFTEGSEPVVAAAPGLEQQGIPAHQQAGPQAQAPGFHVQQRELQHTLAGETVPLVPVPEEGVALVSWQGKASWSLGNSILSLIGLTEGLLAIVCFFTRSTRPRPNLLTRDFMQRLLALLMAFVFLIATSIASDFTGSLILFDRMSLPIIMLFALQQAVLLDLLQQKTPPSTGRGMRNRFRAQQRYED
jgi:hypothetical protein